MCRLYSVLLPVLTTSKHICICTVCRQWARSLYQKLPEVIQLVKLLFILLAVIRSSINFVSFFKCICIIVRLQAMTSTWDTISNLGLEIC